MNKVYTSIWNKLTINNNHSTEGKKRKKSEINISKD